MKNGMTAEGAYRALNVLGKWRVFLTGWQLGTRAKGDPEGDAVRDSREALLILRAELNGLTALLIEKGVFTEEEFQIAAGNAAVDADRRLSERFPGVYATDEGLTFTREAAETMRRMNFKP